MGMKKILGLFALLSIIEAEGQSALLPFDFEDVSRIQRLEIKTGQFASGFHTSLNNINRKDLALYADSFSLSGNPISSRDFEFLGFIQSDNPEWTNAQGGKRNPFLGFLYPEVSTMLMVKKKGFAIRVNPILNLQAGRDLERDESLFINTRGVETHGHIHEKIGFYTYITENQVRAPYYLRQFTGSTGHFPSAGLTKAFKGSGYDFIQARGYVTVSPVKDHLQLQFGHDRNFVGDGYRSFILSDFGKEYLFLKVNTKIWKLNYMNLFAEMAQPGGRIMGKKYVALHHLSYNILPNLNVGVFETVVFDRTDSLGINHGFELNYLNPVILYRSVEHGLNSSDNALIGINAKWNFLRHFSLYGQLTLDEFKLDEYRNNRNWWGNKYAAQVGLKIIDAFLMNLDLQYEYNIARPYTFMHDKVTQNYTHYNTPLGHPLGANFREHVALLTYRLSSKLGLYATYLHTEQGLDYDQWNWGAQVRNKPYRPRPNDYGVKVGQGALTRVNLLELRVSYQWAHRAFFEVSYVYRDSKSELVSYNHKLSMLNLGLRMNLARPRNLF